MKTCNSAGISVIADFKPINRMGAKVAGFFPGILLFSGMGIASGERIPPPTDTITLRNIGQTTLKVPEELVFDIVWGGWSFSWVHAGQATLDLKTTSNPMVWEIRSLARCNSFFQSFYPVSDTVVSFINAKGIYPLKFQKILHEGSYHARILADYDQQKHVIRTMDTLLTIDPFTHDVLSAFYFIRTQPLEVGKNFELSAISGKKKYALKVLCLREETIDVPAGKFHCLVVEPVLKEDGLFKAKGKLWIWLTQDVRHLPVKMQSKIPVGSIKAELVRSTVQITP